MKNAGIMVAIGLGVLLLTLTTPRSWAQSTPTIKVRIPEKREWRLVGLGTGGAMFSIGMHPTDSKTFYSGVDMGALYKTSDGGRSWQIMGGTGPENPNPAPLGAFGVAVDPGNPENVWSASGDIFKSENAGKTWKQVNSQENVKNLYFEHVIPDPKDGNVVYAVGHHLYDGNVARTADGGKTWSIILPSSKSDPRHWWGLVIDPQSKFVEGKGHLRIYLFGEEGLFRSEDAGGTWENITNNLPKSPIRNVVLVPKSGGESKMFLFVSCTPKWINKGEKTYEGGVFRSEDNGKNWTKSMQGIGPLAVVEFEPKRFHLANSKSDPGILFYAFGFSYVYKSKDLGETWHLICDAKSEWVKIKKNPPKLDEFEDYFLPIKGGNCHLAHHSSEGAINGLAVSPCDPRVILFTQESYIVGTFDGGKTWSDLCADVGKPFAKSRWTDPRLVPSDHTHLLKNRGIHLIEANQMAFDPFSPNNTMAIAYFDVGLRISHDGGTWWEWAYDKSSMIRGDSGSANTVVFDRDVRGRLYLGTGKWSVGDVFRSDDGGRTFTRLNLAEVWEKVKKNKVQTGELFKPVFSRIVIDPSSKRNMRTLYAGIRFHGYESYKGLPVVGGVRKSIDGGASWKECCEGLGPSAIITELVLDELHPQTLFAGTYNSEGPTGLFKTTDGGQSWRNLASEEIASITANCIALCRNQPKSIYVVAYPPGKAALWGNRILLRSDNSGETWQVVREGFVSSVAVNPCNPDWVYITVPRGVHYSERGGVLRSKDGGKSWEPIDDGVIVEGASRSRIELDILDPRRLIHYSLYGVWIGFDPEAPHGEKGT